MYVARKVRVAEKNSLDAMATGRRPELLSVMSLALARITESGNVRRLFPSAPWVYPVGI